MQIVTIKKLRYLVMGMDPRVGKSRPAVPGTPRNRFDLRRELKKSISYEMVMVFVKAPTNGYLFSNAVIFPVKGKINIHF